MDKATLTISLPRTMKEFIAEKLREGRFSTPSEYIRSLIRDDQDLATGRLGPAVWPAGEPQNAPVLNPRSDFEGAFALRSPPWRLRAK